MSWPLSSQVNKNHYHSYHPVPLCSDPVRSCLIQVICSIKTAFPASEINGIHIPQTYEQAVKDPKYSIQWKEAMTQELISLLENGTWREVVPPEGVNLVSTNGFTLSRQTQMDRLNNSRHVLLQEDSVKYMAKITLRPLLQQSKWIL